MFIEENNYIMIFVIFKLNIFPVSLLYVKSSVYDLEDMSLLL